MQDDCREDGRSCFSPLDVTAKLDSRVGNVRAHSRLRAVQPSRDFLRGQTFHVAEQNRLALAGSQQTETVLQIRLTLGSKQNLLRTLRRTSGRLAQIVDIADADPPVAAQKIDGRIRGDA